jgi:hypothetical protein
LTLDSPLGRAKRARGTSRDPDEVKPGQRFCQAP